MWYFVALFALFIVGIFDGHTSSFAAMFLMFLLGFLSVNSIKSQVGITNGGKVFGIVFSVYIISAFIASRSFLDGQYFYVVDSMKYIEEYGNISIWSWNYTFTILSQTYLFFADNNGLFNQSLAAWAYIANHYLDGTTVFYLTLFQTLFGMLAILEVYKIFLLYFESQKAAKYACIFALLSLFHIYSIVIIRDIVIVYFYMLGLRKIMGKPKISDIFVLLFVMVVTIGVRLYTGLFFGTFIMFWLYKLLQEKKYAGLKFLLFPIIMLGIFFVGSAFLSSVLVENTVGQIEEYDELYSETKGIARRFRSLPIGVSQIVILFFSQLPLDDLRRLSLSTSFSNYYLSILAIVYQIFGFVIFYGLMYYCFVKGFFRKLTSNDRWLLIIMLIFIALNLSTHMDVRRSMEAIPFIYLFYMQAMEQQNRRLSLKINKVLVAMGLFLMIAYSIVS